MSWKDRWPTGKPTWGELLGPAMVAKTQEEADALFADMVGLCIESYGQTQEEARTACLNNIGYYAGYYDDETAGRVRRLFGAAHPIFGTTRPTAEEAFAKGKDLAEKSHGDPTP